MLVCGDRAGARLARSTQPIKKGPRSMASPRLATGVGTLAIVRVAAFSGLASWDYTRNV